MKSFKFVLLLMLAIVAVSCSKDDDDSVDPFFKINGINAEEFSTSWGRVGDFNSPDIKHIYYGYSNKSNNVYYWFCDEKSQVICTSILNVPKQIIEDQGYGNLVTCEWYGSYYVTFINSVDNIEFYCYTPSYENLKNKFSYLFVYKDRKIYTHKIENDVTTSFKILNWYNNSYLLGNMHEDYSFCVTENGEKVTMFKDKGKARFRDVFDNDTYPIPLDYTKCIILFCSKLTDTEMGFCINIESFDTGEILGFTAPSPFDPSEKFITNNASLIESTNEYYLIECQVTAYSGEKKTVRIRINLGNKKAELVS